MQKLVEGLNRFHAGVFRSHRELFRQLARRQTPETLFITCSDSRIDPSLLTQTRPGELFIMRNAGNLVPCYTGEGTGEAATVEYAVAVLGVKDIIVCGHSNCGAIRGLFETSKLDAVPLVKNWLVHAESTRRIIVENYPQLEGDARLSAASEENVLTQLEHLETHPSVAVRLARHDLKLHGWYYAIDTGGVYAFDPRAGQFRSILKGRGPQASKAVGARRRDRRVRSA